MVEDSGQDKRVENQALGTSVVCRNQDHVIEGSGQYMEVEGMALGTSVEG